MNNEQQDTKNKNLFDQMRLVQHEIFRWNTIFKHIGLFNKNLGTICMSLYILNSEDLHLNEFDKLKMYPAPYWEPVEGENRVSDFALSQMCFIHFSLPSLMLLFNISFTPLSLYPHSQPHPTHDISADNTSFSNPILFSAVAVHRCPEAHFLSRWAPRSGLRVRRQLGRCAQQTTRSRLYSQCESEK